jgi:hypothetical protein
MDHKIFRLEFSIRQWCKSLKKIKALFLSANPKGTKTLQLDEEIRGITNKIEATDYRDSIEMISAWAVRPDDLLQLLNTHKPQIVHFSGHGSSNGEIILTDNNGDLKPISAKAIQFLFKTLKDNIRLVILNACYSRSQAEAITTVIDCAIGMNESIGDKAAIVFAASFYRAIGFGRSVKEAFDQGIAALLLEDIPEENNPELVVKEGVNPSNIFLIYEYSSGELSQDIELNMPFHLKELILSGVEFIDIPIDQLQEELRPRVPGDYLFCELKMQKTGGVFVLRVPKIMTIGDAAKYLMRRLFPQERERLGFYDWNLLHNDKVIPVNHTFATSGIRSGDKILLRGEFHAPPPEESFWAPMPMPRDRRF